MPKKLILWLLLGLVLAIAAGCAPAAATNATPAPTAKIVTDVPQQVEITDLSFTELEDGKKVAINACTEGYGGVGLTMRVRYNASPDGTDAGDWQVVKELGVPCFNTADRPVWDVSNLTPGKYLVKVEVKTPKNPNWENAVYKTAIYEVK